ncbi:MAG: DUF4038 domain-containing protein [Bacteroidota bacterium]
MKLRTLPLLVLILICVESFGQTGIWMKKEITLESDTEYENPLFQVSELNATFTAPSGRELIIRGFWDGGKVWKFRFVPDEVGTWTYRTTCSDNTNAGLHEKQGSFECIKNTSSEEIYQRGSVKRNPGKYHLSYSDGTPFFWMACTAWNGALKSTEPEWDQYLTDRKSKGYNTIQFVTTQWRGGEGDRDGRVAFTGSGRIELNIDFFKRLDGKVDRINEYGLVAAPVLLWALPAVRGRELSPGYFLPQDEAIMLAKYMVARYGGNQVVWILGGDGEYLFDYEQRWKVIGRGVFGEGMHQGIVAQHPHGKSWIGKAYTEEEWLDILGYQSSHNTGQGTVDWLNKGPMVQDWDRIPARPIMNLEPIYEQILQNETTLDVRQATYWSLFATPISGVTYGANGIWPWLREGETILNHRDAPWTGTWSESLKLPAGTQVPYAKKFFETFNWWEFTPAHEELLIDQPGDKKYNDFVPMLKSPDYKTILVYFPTRLDVRIVNKLNLVYSARLFDPVKGTFTKTSIKNDGNVLAFSQLAEQDMVLILEAK